MMRYLSFLAVVPALICSHASAADDGALAKLSAGYQAQLDKITEAHSAALTALDEQVLGALARAQETAKKAGDTATADEVEKELARWKLEGGMPESESSVPAIEKIHQIYTTQKAAKLAERNRQVAAWYQSYDAKLTGLQEKGGPAGEIAAEREKISESFLVREALESAESAPPVATGTKPAEVTKPAAPVATGPWQNLKKVKWSSMDGNKYFKGGVETWKDDITLDGKEHKVRDIIYTHGGGSVTYTFKAPISAFKATGCMEERTGQGNVFFVISTDEGEVYRTKPVTKDHTTEPIDLTFKPTMTLTIKADPNGGEQEDWAFLLEPKYR